MPVTMIDRRQFVATAAAGAAAIGATAALPAAAQMAGATAAPRDPRLEAILVRVADQALALSPIAASYLGLDKGARAALKSGLDDQSPAGRERALALAAATRADLAKVPRGAMRGQDLTLYDTLGYALDLALAARPFAFGGNGYNALGTAATPYIVSQQGGAFSGIPEFLDATHQIDTAADAEAYLSRLGAFADVLDAETAIVTDDAGRGVIAPDVVLDNLLGQLRGGVAVAAGDQRMVASLATRTAAKNLAGDWRARATAIVAAEVLPALRRQLAAVEAVRGRADDRTGVWKLPRGDEYYAWALRCGTTTNLSADEVHRTGIEQTKAIQAEIDTLLRARGMTTGTVGERLTAMTEDPANLYPDSDAGRAELIGYVNNRLDAIRPLMARVSNLKLRADVTVKRVPVDIQDGASQGYMNFASLDGSRPAIYYINLKLMRNWPRWSLPTLTTHEGLPGHAWQGAWLAENSAQIPLVSSLMGFNAFIEGWALYGEQMADEGGFYADDPLGRIGYLAAQNFRAVRLVIDTGIHAKRWTRAEAIEWMFANTGRARTAVTSEVDRYSVSPGQACGYKVGHNEIVRLRTRAQAALGPRFDLPGFNDAVVTTGGVPLAVLGPVVDRWVASRRA